MRKITNVLKIRYTTSDHYLYDLLLPIFIPFFFHSIYFHINFLFFSLLLFQYIFSIFTSIHDGYIDYTLLFTLYHFLYFSSVFGKFSNFCNRHHNFFTFCPSFNFHPLTFLFPFLLLLFYLFNYFIFDTETSVYFQLKGLYVFIYVKFKIPTRRFLIYFKSNITCDIKTSVKQGLRKKKIQEKF